MNPAAVADTVVSQSVATAAAVAAAAGAAALAAVGSAETAAVWQATAVLSPLSRCRCRCHLIWGVVALVSVLLYGQQVVCNGAAAATVEGATEQTAAGAERPAVVTATAAGVAVQQLLSTAADGAVLGVSAASC